MSRVQIHLTDGAVLECDLSPLAVHHLERWLARSGPGMTGVRTVHGDRCWLNVRQVRAIDEHDRQPAPYRSADYEIAPTVHDLPPRGAVRLAE